MSEPRETPLRSEQPVDRDGPEEQTSSPGPSDAGPADAGSPNAGSERTGAVDELAQAVRQRDEYLDALQRLKAEFDNYRKRVAREQESLSLRAAERLVKQLLPMLDDLDRAVAAAVEHGEVKVADGVRLVHRALADMLTREGLVEVETDGPFDPHTQEALLSQPSDAPEGTVIQVVQKGYRLGDHVLRPARVVVSAGVPGAGTP
ncbi:MAG TPA: nucleotide exchange factor GrpE [Gaiellaceae bacterium]